MKKSTLITTIAMIVVVVVALSTATYAWFTASATTTAVVNMQTTAQADFGLTVVPSVVSSMTWADGTTGVGVALTNQSLAAPSSAINTAIAFSESSVGFVQDKGNASFYEANYASNSTATVATAATPVGVDALRLTNIKTDDKKAYLYIVIAIDAGKANANTVYAAQATSFYVHSEKSSASNIMYAKKANGDANESNYTGETSRAVASTWTNGYYTHKSGDASTADATLTMADSATTGAGSFESVALIEDSVVAGDQAKTARPAYNGSLSGFIHQNNTANEALGVQANQYVLAYVIDLGTLAPNESLVLSVYTWIDGWVANNAAGGAAFNVTYAFTSSLQYLTKAA